ncbi:MAG: pyridoxamine 5-phosphate oxidase [Alphaproteobacteria bacterium]|nr:pyridoxamine 5-phosphate oxidase [Alphaproteobacteria bacterium]
MTSHFVNLLTSPAVKAAQEANGSRAAMARHDDAAGEADRLTEREAAFIAVRDSFYMATVGHEGWPYMQHRGGPAGFVKVLSERTFAFADFRGNRQFLSVGNLTEDNRAAFFFMDYPNRARLKVLGRVRSVELEANPALAKALIVPGYKAVPERALVVDVEAFDWNCPQHITPRFTVEQIEPAVEALKARIAELEVELKRRPTV